MVCMLYPNAYSKVYDIIIKFSLGGEKEFSARGRREERKI